MNGMRMIFGLGVDDGAVHEGWLRASPADVVRNAERMTARRVTWLVASRSLLLFILLAAIGRTTPFLEDCR